MQFYAGSPTYCERAPALPPQPSRAQKGAERLSRTGWLSRAPAPFRLAVLKSTIWYEAPAATEFIHSHDTEGGLFAVADGIAEISFLNAHPDTRALHVARAGFWAGQRPLLGRARTLSVRARTDVLWALVPQATLRALLAQEPAWWEQIAQLSEDSAELLSWAVADLTRHDSRKRAAALLLRLAGCRLQQDGNPPPLEIALPQGDIAAMAVMSRSTFGKALAEFTKRGWVEGRYARILLLDAAGMRHFLDDCDDCDEA